MACDICGGSRRISVRVIHDGPPSMVEASRRYPCPECSAAKMIDPARFTVLRVNERIPLKFINDESAIESRKLNLSRQIARLLLERKLALVRTDAESGVMNMAVGIIRPKGVTAPREIRDVEVEVTEIPMEFFPERQIEPERKLGARQLILEDDE